MRPLWQKLLPWFAVALGCSSPKAVVVASFPPDSGADASSTGEVGAGSADSGSAPSPVPVPRGRVHIANGALVTDLGTPLRGALLAADSTTWMLRDFDMLTSIAASSGLNAVHVYLENSSLDTGSRESEGDALIALAAQAGLYVIVGYGTGTNVGKLDADQAKAFWSIYAARYANQSHVLFELQNNPEFTCDQPISDATLTFERETYALVRGLAPESHILLFSATSVVQPSVLTDAITRLGSSVSFDNASFALTMTQDCLAPSNLSELTSVAKQAQVPLFLTQLPALNWAPALQAFEAAQLGWMQYNWFANAADVPSFVNAIRSAGLSWCPERGIFPEDAATCGATH